MPYPWTHSSGVLLLNICFYYSQISIFTSLSMKNPHFSLASIILNYNGTISLFMGIVKVNRLNFISWINFFTHRWNVSNLSLTYLTAPLKMHFRSKIYNNALCYTIRVNGIFLPSNARTCARKDTLWRIIRSGQKIQSVKCVRCKQRKGLP